jgi:hypothetical protein
MLHPGTVGHYRGLGGTRESDRSSPVDAECNRKQTVLTERREHEGVSYSDCNRNADRTRRGRRQWKVRMGLRQREPADKPRLGVRPASRDGPMSVTSPPLPVAAGPYSTSHTFTSPDGSGASVTVTTKAQVAVALSSPLTNLSLTFNGTPGFPVPPAPGIYKARVQMTLPSGAEVFCADFTLTDISFVSVATPVQTPTLSWHGRIALLLLLAGCGLFALRWGAG